MISQNVINAVSILKCLLYVRQFLNMALLRYICNSNRRISPNIPQYKMSDFEVKNEIIFAGL